MNSKPIFTTPPSTQLLPKEYAVIRPYMLGWRGRGSDLFTHQ